MEVGEWPLKDPQILRYTSSHMESDDKAPAELCSPRDDNDNAKFLGEIIS